MPDPSALIAHWPLHGDARDVCGSLHGSPAAVAWTVGPSGAAGTAALFNGVDSRVIVDDRPELQLGGKPFTLSAWVRCGKPMRGAFGEVASKFDAELRCGLNLTIAGSSAAYCGMSDARHVHAGIDDAWLGEWLDCGRPAADNPLVTALTTFNGELYAGVSDAADPNDACRVFRWAGGTDWEDCGRLGDAPHAISAMAMLVHDGALYGGTAIWDWVRVGAAQTSNPPVTATGVYRYEGGKTWRDMKLPGAAQRVITMASFDGDLFVGLDRGAQGRCYRLHGDEWIDAGVLDEWDNFECLMPVAGVLYGASHKAVYRYEGGTTWTCIGRKPFDIVQIHAFQQVAGRLWIGTWPQGYVLRHEPGDQWINTGRLGLATERPGVAPINEINALGMHNGKLYAGVLPKAGVYRYEADGQWTLLDNLASRPDWAPGDIATWLRVMALTTHRGELFACTGSCRAHVDHIDEAGAVGRVWRRQAGVVASHEHDLGDAWTHLAMARDGSTVRLYVNGALAGESRAPAGRFLDLGNAQPLLIGCGPQGSFDGAISDVRLYGAALDAAGVGQLAADKP